MVDEFAAICTRFGQMAARGVCKKLRNDYTRNFGKKISHTSNLLASDWFFNNVMK